MTVQPQSPARPRRTALVIAAVVVGLVVVMAGVAAVVIPLLWGQPFDSVQELSPDNIQSLHVRVLNRTDLDGGQDVGPYYAAEADYAKLLEPLRGVQEVADYPDARGPLLGEYRVRTKSGRRGTIRLYWVKTPQDAPTTPARLRFQIGPHKYEGGTAAAVTAAAEAGAARGEPAGR